MRKCFGLFTLVAMSWLIGITSSLALPSETNSLLPPQATLQNQIVFLNPIAAQHFDATLLSLADQSRVTIVCEGQPLQLDLPKKEIERLVLKFGRNGLPIADAIAEVASAFDYNSTRTDSNIYLLAKKYSKKEDVPEISFEEAETTLQNIMKATQKFQSTDNPSVILSSMMASVTPEEKAQLAQGLPLTQLPVEWRQGAFLLASKFTLQPLESVGEITQRLHGCKDKKTVFEEMHFLNLSIPSYRGPFGPNGTMRSVALSHWINTQSGGATVFNAASNITIEGAGNHRLINIGNEIDPTTPRRGTLSAKIASSTLKMSFSEIVQSINIRLAKTAVEITSAKIEPCLSTKTICLVGEDYTDAITLLKSVATLYGLEIKQQAQAITITLPKPKMISDPGEVSSEFKRLIPISYQRKISNGGNPSASISDERMLDLYDVSVQRLREIIEPLVKKRLSQRMPSLSMPEASDEAHKMVALSSLATCALDFRSLEKPVAPFMSNFDNATFYIQPNKENPNSISFKIEAPTAEGKVSGIMVEITAPSVH